MSQFPLVTVIIPAHNASRFIQETIRSVLNQSYTNFEILVIDDGSTDHTYALVNEMKQPNIRIMRKEKSGVSDSRNMGIIGSNGELLVFLDADDILGKDFLALRVQELVHHPEIDFCYSYIRKINENGDLIPGEFQGPRDSSFNEDILLYRRPDVITCPSNFLFRKTALVDHGISFNPILSSSADRFFLLRVNNVCKHSILVNKEAFLFYRVHSKSMSNFFSSTLINDAKNFAREVSQLSFLDENLLKNFLNRANFLISASLFKNGNYFQSLVYALQAAILNPLTFLKDLKSILSRKFA